MSKYILTVFAVHCGGHRLHLVGVPHLLPPETGKVLQLNEVTLLLLQGKPRSVDEPLAPHHRDTVLLWVRTHNAYHTAADA